MSLTLPGSGFGAFPRLFERARLAGASLAASVRAMRNRHHALRVAELPDYLLKDMGLQRDDVHAALRSDWRSDPTDLLARSAQERRCRN